MRLRSRYAVLSLVAVSSGAAVLRRVISPTLYVTARVSFHGDKKCSNRRGPRPQARRKHHWPALSVQQPLPLALLLMNPLMDLQKHMFIRNAADCGMG